METSAPLRSRLIASGDIDRFYSISTSLRSETRGDEQDKKYINIFSDNLYLNQVSHKQEYYIVKQSVEISNGVTWRLKERMKTSGVALVVCLNIGIDPPDIIKPNPCARKECWFDPTPGSGSKQKGLEFIGHALQQQYEKWQSKAKYKQCLDPTSEELRRVCMNLRKSSKNDRLLLHYNGHGVPKPTKNGELWVFGKYYTHYTPVAICELKSWLGDPAIYVLDCSAAGVLITQLVDGSVMEQSIENERFGYQSNIQQPNIDSPTIVLAACKANEVLPFNPLYPADLFTSCLTTPITIAIKWFILQNPYSMADVNPDIGGNIPGKDTDRKSPRGELNWIFTAITDTIAWTSLTSKTFQKMFRQDLLVASLFRNFLLATRIMKSFNCEPQSSPHLPDTSTHHLWQSWDMTLESFINHNVNLQRGTSMIDPLNNMPLQLPSNLTFFTDQLTAFDLWLDFSSSTSEPPEYLPIVLQVLLSQTHRLRALQLLKRYLALGPNAVNLSLVVGIYPYILKLLQSPTEDIKQTLIAIWASIIGFDSSCRQELIREKSQSYFIQFLQSKGMPANQKCLSAFVLAEICNQYREGQQTCLNLGLHRSCTSILSQPEVMESVNLKKWICLCLFKLCEDFPWAKYLCITETAHTQLYPLLIDLDPNVRTAALLALGEIFGASKLTDSLAAGAGSASAPSTPSRSTSFNNGGNNRDIDDKDLREAELHLAWQLLDCCTDGAVSVRLEVVLALSKCFLLPAHIDCIKIVAKSVYKINKLKKNTRNSKQSETDAFDASNISNQSLFHPWLLTPAETDTVIVLVEEHIKQQSQPIESISLLNTTTDSCYSSVDIGSLNTGNSKNWLKPLNTLPEDLDDFNREPNEFMVVPSDSINIEQQEQQVENQVLNESSTIPSLYGLMASVYVRVWLALTEIQGRDPCPIVANTAKMLRYKVYMLILLDEKHNYSQSNRNHSSINSPVNQTKASSSYLNFALNSSTASPLNSPVFYLRKTSSSNRNSSFVSDKGIDDDQYYDSDVTINSNNNAKKSAMISPPSLFPLSISENNHPLHSSTSSTGEFKSYQLPPPQQSLSVVTDTIIDESNCKNSNQSFFMKDILLKNDLLFDKAIEINEFDFQLQTSNTYQEAKESFLTPDEGYEPIEDPLSMEGSNRAFRMKEITEIMYHQKYLTNLFKEISSEDKTDLFLSSSETKLKTNLISDDSINNNIQQSRSAVSTLPTNVTKFEEKALLTINNAVMTSLVMFHPFHDILAVSDESKVSIWSLTKSSRIMEMSNKHSIMHNNHSDTVNKISVSESSIFSPLAEPRITAMHWINESYNSLLLLGTDDGVIKVWRDISFSSDESTDSSSSLQNHNHKDISNTRSKSVDLKDHSIVELATAFTALPDIAETSRGSGLLLSWQQATGTLVAGGNSNTIRVWDLGREQCVRMFDTGSKTCLTALAATTSANIYNSIYSDPHNAGSIPSNHNNTSDIPLSWTFAGFADGTVAIYDERVQSNGGRVYQSRDHSAWVVSAHIRLDAMEAVTSSVRGTVKFWDMRTLRTYKTLDVQKSSLTSMTVHNTLPIIATGSHAQFIKILTFGGEQLGNIIKYHDGFLGQRIGPITSLAFHPHRMMLAASAADCIVSVYGTNDAINSSS